jgi:superfamily I DNA and/or RNA helicase
MHVNSDVAQGHWIPDEGLLLRAFLTDLLAGGERPETILLITPFRAVAVELRRIARKFGIKRAGTVHVAQGAESGIVIFVLGGNPRSDAAREWAAERPNLLNVAVSRAKHRLYIIGNRELWEPLPHFSQADRLLREKYSEASV